MFKPGDKVRRKKQFQDSTLHWQHGDDIVTVSECSNHTIRINQQFGVWDQHRFQLVEQEQPKAKKDDNGKPRFDILFSIRGLSSVCDVFAHGASKYDDFNWRKAGNDSSYKLKLLAASLRHIYKHMAGQRLDPETGKPHLAHAVCDLLMVLDIQES